MLFQHSITAQSFKQWLRQDRENKLLLKIALAVIVVQFIVFKLLYPYPNFMPPDSDSYIEAAFNNQFIDLWAIGYSKFLRLFSCFTNSDKVIVWFQYLLLQGGLLYLLFTLRYLLSIGKWLFRILLIVSILNPLLPHVSNFVSSDALFTALSLLWFTQLLWILYRPKRRLLLWHAVILLFAFMVRYNALFYPCISIPAIIMAHLHWRTKLLGTGAIILLIGLFTGSTVREYYKKTGTFQYSAFGGWLVGSNALYGYAYAKTDPVESVPIKFRPLHRIVNRHMDSIRHLLIRPDAEVAIYYFWDFKSPLRIYMDNAWKGDTVTGFLERWASMAPLYAAYGRYLVLRHPQLYLRHYLWPNFLKYYAPPAKFMGIYNMGGDRVSALTAQWFRWKSTKVSSFFKDKQLLFTEGFSVISAIVNLLFVVCFIAFAWFGGLKHCASISRRILWWTLLIWTGNMCFSVAAAPIELRYQLFSLIITTVFLGLLLYPLVMAAIRPPEQLKVNILPQQKQSTALT